jgi:predicted ATPase
MATRRTAPAERPREPFVSWLELDRSRVASADEYPFSLPCVAALSKRLPLDPYVTFFVGENGSGKSTLVEALAVALGYNAEGGTKNFNFSTRASESSLGKSLRVARSSRQPRAGFFLRAESFFNVATNIEQLGVLEFYGGRSLHEQSHGESFMTLIRERFKPSGLYILDEPESALSPTRQLDLLREMRRHCRQGSQFIIATHSPLLLAYPNACIYEVSKKGLSRILYEDTEHYRVTLEFLERPRQRLEELFADIDVKPPAPAIDSGAAEHYRRALAKYARGEIVLALQELSTAIDLAPQQAEPYFRRGLWRLELSATAKALEDFDRAIELGGGDGAKLARAVALRELGQLEASRDAVADVEPSTEVDIGAEYWTVARLRSS